MSWFKLGRKHNQEKLRELEQRKHEVDEREEEITRRTDALVELAKVLQRETNHDPGSR